MDPPKIKPLQDVDDITIYNKGLIAETRQAMKDSPKQIFNAYVFGCTWIFALSGVAKGFDEGVYLKKSSFEYF